MRITLMSISLISIGLLAANLSFAEIDPEEVWTTGARTGHVWLFEDVKDNRVEDNSQNNLRGTVRGNANAVIGINGEALEFDGEDDIVEIPDSAHINYPGGPWKNKTIKIIFKCADVFRKGKQTASYPTFCVLRFAFKAFYVLRFAFKVFCVYFVERITMEAFCVVFCSLKEFCYGRLFVISGSFSDSHDEPYYS